MAESQSDRKSSAETTIGVKKGQVLFQQGEPVTHCYVVKTGQVELTLIVGGQELRVGLLGSGELFGEAALLENHLSPVIARVIADGTLIKVEGSAFAEVVRQRPEVGLLAIRRLAARNVSGCAAWTALLAEAASVRLPTVERPAAAGAEASHDAGPEVIPLGPRLVHPETATIFSLPDQDEALVGRADPRTKFKPDIELSRVDKQLSLSRRHARVTRHKNVYAVVEEPKVANGTFVNGQRLTAGQPVTIKDGDEVCFGLVRTIFRAR
jgi:hypothetical protein